MNNALQKALAQLNQSELSSIAELILSELSQNNSSATTTLDYVRDSALINTSPGSVKPSARIDPYVLLNAIRETAAYPSSGGGFPGNPQFGSSISPSIQNSDLLSRVQSYSSHSADNFPSMQPPQFIQHDSFFYQPKQMQSYSKTSITDPVNDPANPPNPATPDAVYQQNTLMSAVSEFFRRDSRRYDSGFERY